MKDFSHPSGGEFIACDIHDAIKSTVTIARNEWKYVAEVDFDFATDLPPVPCLRDELNQVFLNLIVNATHAIADAVKGTDHKGRITIRTRLEDEWIVIQISDTGGGIPETARGRVFDPFFTTKEIGRGTGQGLSIARTVIVQKHGGELSFTTEAGVSTTFCIRLPMAPRNAAAA
jgi:signal transduction histidine kinase